MDAIGCFSPYMAISSTLQTVFGIQRRNELERTAEESQRLAEDLRIAREQVDSELEDLKIKELQAKMIVARKYRAEEKYEVNKLNEMASEVRLYFNKFLPIDGAMLPVILDTAHDYRVRGYDFNCPLNVVLLHAGQSLINYESINDKLEKLEAELGNVVFRRWCNKNIGRNGAILNLNYVMANIPTLVISPCMQGGMIHFTVSMWEAQSGQKPLIRPLFSLGCNKEELKSEEGKARIESNMVFVTTVITGCARDSYMLMSLGCRPTFPRYLEKHPDVKKMLGLPIYKDVKQFVIDEYASAVKQLGSHGCQSGLLTSTEMSSLTSMASKALTKISSSI